MNETLPIIAAAIGIIAQSGYYAQAWRIFVDKSSKNVSITMFILYIPLMTLWIWYGILIMNIPVLICNITGIIGCVLTIFLHVKYREAK